jgi:hypothetical protein
MAKLPLCQLFRNFTASLPILKLQCFVEVFSFLDLDL